MIIDKIEILNNTNYGCIVGSNNSEKIVKNILCKYNNQGIPTDIFYIDKNNNIKYHFTKNKHYKNHEQIYNFFIDLALNNYKITQNAKEVIYQELAFIAKKRKEKKKHKNKQKVDLFNKQEK